MPLAIAFLLAGRRPVAGAVLVAMAVTDGLDGFLARRMGRVTGLGKLLDSLADKIAIDSLLAFLTLRGEFPGWALAVIVARDLGILVGASTLARKTAFVWPPNAMGKVTLIVLAAMTFVFVLNLAAIEAPLLWAGIACVAVSAVGYVFFARATLAAAGAREQVR